MLPRPQGIGTRYHVQPTDPTVRIRRSYGDPYGNQSNLGARRRGKDHAKFENSNGIEFSLHAQKEEDSGASSPPLWKTSPPMSPKARASAFQHRLPPTSRSQAIAQGRQEMMEMIQGMPETAYELSLKDLVESPLNKSAWQSAAVEAKVSKSEVIHEERKMNMMTKKNCKRVDSKNRKVENGHFLIKMFFPAVLGSKKKSGTGQCAKVSPKPISNEGEKAALEGRVDGEWWKKRFSATEESEGSTRSRSSGLSSSSSHGRCRHVAGFLAGCVPFFSNKSTRSKRKGCLF